MSHMDFTPTNRPRFFPGVLSGRERELFQADAARLCGRRASIFMSFLRSISTLRCCWPGHLNLVDAQRASLPSSACQFTRTVIRALARPTGAANSSRFPSGAISNASGLFAGVGGS